MARREVIEERHLEVLGLSKVASLAQIRSAYYQQSQQLWNKPKKLQTPEEQEEEQDVLVKLRDALDYFERQWSPMVDDTTGNKK